MRAWLIKRADGQSDHLLWRRRILWQFCQGRARAQRLMLVFPTKQFFLVETMEQEFSQRERKRKGKGSKQGRQPYTVIVKPWPLGGEKDKVVQWYCTELLRAEAVFCRFSCFVQGSPHISPNCLIGPCIRANSSSLFKIQYSRKASQRL